MALVSVEVALPLLSQLEIYHDWRRGGGHGRKLRI